jgi:predicted N-acetyltransferase YhbS
MDESDAEAVSNLIQRTFHHFIADTYKARGKRYFLRHTSKSAMLRRKRENQLIVVAETGNTVSGIIAVRRKNHISLLFVAPEFHGKGIGSLLCREAISRITAAIPNPHRVTVNSSEHALPFYAKIGFTVKRPAYFHKGMKITPLELVL